MTRRSFSSGGVAASLVAFASCGRILGGVTAFAPPTSATARLGGGVRRQLPRCESIVAAASSSAAVPDLDREGIGGEKGESSGRRPRLLPAVSDRDPGGCRPSLPYIRIQKRGRHYDVQTAVTTFQKSDQTVDLHAQIHFADASYFEYFNDLSFAYEYDKVLYELIVEEKFLEESSSAHDAPSLRRLMPASSSVAGGSSPLNPIAPTRADRSTAAQYGLRCQVDGIRYCKDDWVHADLTREEFLELLEDAEQNKQTSRQRRSSDDRQQPLWALASTSATYPGSELVASLQRPLTTTTASDSAALTRRLFTHLFLPGDALSGWIRAVLWLGVPSPELSVMLVDWSSLSYLSARRNRRRGTGREEGANDDGNNGVGPISPIAAPVFLSLLTGNWGTARRLVFGQILAGGQAAADASKGGVLIEKRNERAVDVLRASLSSLSPSDNRDETHEDGAKKKKGKRVALLYGAGHCRDLHRRLVGEEGMTPVRTEWRTAFRATAPRWGDFVDGDDWRARTRDVVASGGGEDIVGSMSASTLESVAVGLVVLPLYLLVGGFDWVSAVADLGTALDEGAYLDGAASLLLYLLRHAALYVGISKFVVDWGGNEGIFEDDERV